MAEEKLETIVVCDMGVNICTEKCPIYEHCHPYTIKENEKYEN